MKKGISMVALVITVIVAIILVGAIILTTVENGIIDKAKTARDAKNIKEVFNAVQVEVLALQQEYGGISIDNSFVDEFVEKLQTNLRAKYPDSDAIVQKQVDSETGELSIKIIFNLSGKQYELILNSNYILSQPEEVIVIPPEPEPVYEYEAVSAANPELWTVEDYVDTEDGETKHRIIAYLGTGDQLTDVVIPNKVGDKVITQIGDDDTGTPIVAKNGLKGKLTVSNSLYLAKKSCYSTNLEEIELGHSVRTYEVPGTSAAYSALACKTGTTFNVKVTIGDNCTIGKNTFNGKSRINDLTIGKNCTIQGYAFKSCNGLTNLTIPEKCTINGSAFYSCAKIENLDIANNCKMDGSFAFFGLKAVKNINIGSGCLISESAFSNMQSTGTALVVGDNCIIQAGFNYNTGLESVTIGKNCQLIPTQDVPPAGAFSSCSVLNQISIGDNTLVGGYAFKGCTSLTNIVLPQSCTKVSEHIFEGCTALENVTIPQTCTSIGEYAFKGCTSLSGITLPQSCITIDNYAFNECTGLLSITIPQNCTTIGNNAFQSCTSLTIVTTPQNCTTIGEYAFASCTSLTDLTISGAATPALLAFFYCTSLTNVTIGNGATINSDVFNRSNYITTIVIGDNCTIGNNAFSSGTFLNLTLLTSVTIGDNCTICSSAFNGDTSADVVITGTPVSVEQYAFGHYFSENYNCNSVTVKTDEVKTMVQNSGYGKTITVDPTI